MGGQGESVGQENDFREAKSDTKADRAREREELVLGGGRAIME